MGTLLLVFRGSPSCTFSRDRPRLIRPTPFNSFRKPSPFSSAPPSLSLSLIFISIFSADSPSLFGPAELGPDQITEASIVTSCLRFMPRPAWGADAFRKGLTEEPCAIAGTSPLFVVLTAVWMAGWLADPVFG